jgi:hypothetical protein
MRVKSILVAVIAIASIMTTAESAAQANTQRQQSASRKADSLLVERSLSLYSARAISRKQFEQEVGAARADSILMERALAIVRNRVNGIGVTEDRGGRPPSQRFMPTEAQLSGLTAADRRSVMLFYAGAITRKQLDNSLGLVRADSVLRALQDTARVARSTWQISGDSIKADDLRPDSPINPPLVSLGVGLHCTKCSVEGLSDGRVLWTFSQPPVVAAVEPNSIAGRVGLLRGDTLRTVDGLSLTTRAGGMRLSDIKAGQMVRLTWSRNGVSHHFTLVPGGAGETSSARTAPTSSMKVGNASVEVLGSDVSYTRDGRTGELRITTGSATIIVRPPGAVRADTAVRR